MHKDDAARFYLDEHQRPFKVFSRPYDPRQRYAAMDAAALQRTLGEGKYQDPAHYLASVSAWAAGNRGGIAARRTMLHGLLAQGFARADIERALSMPPEELDRLRAEVPYTKPDPQTGRTFGADYRLQDGGIARYHEIEKERESRNG